MDTLAETPQESGSELEGIGPADTDGKEQRLVFFSPTSWMREELLPSLIRSEVPVCHFNDVEGLPKFGAKWPSSFVYIVGDRSQSGLAINWKKQLSTHGESLKEQRIGVVYIDRVLTPARQQEMQVPGLSMAFIELNQSIKNVQQLCYSLGVRLFSKQRRKFVRVHCPSHYSEFNVQINGHTLRGPILDISVAGMACTLPANQGGHLREGMEIGHVQVQLRGSPIMLRAKVATVRGTEDECTVVFIFKYLNDLRPKERIHSYIEYRLQEEFDEYLKNS